VVTGLGWRGGGAVAAIAACRAASVPVLVARGQEDTGELLAAWNAGAAGYLVRRELSPQSMQATVERAMQHCPGRADDAAALARPMRVMQSTCHDLRNPLSAVMINANILLREETLSDERRAKIATRILSSAQRMNRMLDDFADYALAAQGKAIPVRPSDTDLGTIAAETVREVLAAHPGRNLVLQQRGDLRGHWDPGRLRQVMHSLLGSALKRGQPGAVVVVDCCEIVTPAQVEIDLGYRLEPGSAPPPMLALDWQPPPVADGEEARLFVASRIADAHQGSFTMSAEDAIGPRFLIRLPKRVAGAGVSSVRPT
jgi:signal transduction histidine kinase